MKKEIISLAAAVVFTAAASVCAYAETASQVTSNAIDIAENFDTASVSGDVYKGTGKDYTWNIIATKDFGYSTGGRYVAIPDDNKNAVSLTKNNDNNGTKRTILTIPNGAGGVDRDVDITLDAGVCYGFSQTAKAWNLVFTSSAGEEMFSLQLRNGANAIAAAVVAGGKTYDTDYAFTNEKFTNVKATVSFNEGGGGYVTFGNVRADFEEGGDIGSIALQSMSTSDQNRPFVIDNFTMKTVDKTPIQFDVTSSSDTQTVEGALLGVDGNTYTLGEDGSLSKYLRPDTAYTYNVVLPSHERASGEFNVYTADKYTDLYTFSGVEARRPTLIHAYYDEETGELLSVESKNISINNGVYSVEGERRAGCEEKYFLWNSVKGMRPYASAQLRQGENDTVSVELKYHEAVSPDKIELSGGDEYIYIPEEGYAYSSPLTAVVYDDLGFEMKDAVIDWTLPEETAETVGILNGSVTIGSGYTFDEDAHTLKIRASVRGTDIYAEKNLVVRKISDVESFDVLGPIVVKNGSAAQYKVSNITDRYGKELSEVPDFTLTASYADADNTSLAEGESNINGLTLTPDIDLGSGHERKIKVTIALNGTDKQVQKEVTVYDYDFYEPGINSASYGSPRMESVNGVSSIVWPASQSGTRVTSIQLPVPVELNAGSCKVITFDNIATNRAVGSQERSLHFVNSDGIDVINIDFGDKVVLNNWRSGNPYSGDKIGEFTVGEKSKAQITLKTDAQGVTSVIFKYGDMETAVKEPLGVVYDIAEIRMRGSTSAPDDRLLSLTNIKITDGELGGVEISGGDEIAVVYGAEAKKQFSVKVFSTDSGESFTWSVGDENGNEIDGVSIDQDGVLTVSDSVKSLIDKTGSYIPAVVRYTGTKGHGAKQDIRILDYASVKSFNVSGPEYIEAGKTLKAVYTISDIIDDYDNEADMQTAYMITSGEDIARINMSTGEVTLDPTKTGTYTVTAAVGNPGKTKTVDMKVTVARYAETGDATGGSVDVDVTDLANYSEDTKYLVTTATDDGKLVSQSEQSPSGGIVTVDTSNADKYEVSPIYSYSSVGDVSEGKVIPVCDGVYDFTFKKANGTRADIFVNGAMAGQNVDQVSIQRTVEGGSEYTARDIVVEGGKTVVTMKDNTSDMDSITVRKAPSIVTRRTHVYVLGDSLASSYYGTYDSVDENGVPLAGTGQTGWGETLSAFLSDDMIVTNLAESGSAAAALYASTFPGIISNAQAGDYLIMECGYQDSPNSTKEMMLAALENIYNACTEKGVEFIVVTPNCAAHGTTNSEAILRDGGVRFGPDLMAFADEHDMLGIDLSGINGIELPMLLEYGEDYWMRNFNLVRPEDKEAVDKLHSSYWGAVLHAANIATAIDEAQKNRENTDLAERLSGLKLDRNAELVMQDSEGKERKFKIGWYTSVDDIPSADAEPQGE